MVQDGSLCNLCLTDRHNIFSATIFGADLGDSIFEGKSYKLEKCLIEDDVSKITYNMGRNFWFTQKLF